jgi:phosphoribosylamine--glycine ligase
MKEVIEPTVKGMIAEGHPYTGFLYAGLMIDAAGTSKVLEFNCRMGDPETQPIMMRLKSDLVELMNAALDGELDTAEAEWDSRAALGVVLAADGYPGHYSKGDVISGLTAQSDANAKIFHAGTSVQGDDVVTSGGRVLCAVGLGETVTEAQQVAYDLTHSITWNKVYFRDDIGHRAVAREAKD